ADPRLVPSARKLPYVSFEEMLEMAASGAKVLQLRSVEYARTHGVRMHCRSSFEDGPGTVVLGEDETMEHPLITAVTHSTEEARITLLGVPDRPGAAAAIFRALAEANCNVADQDLVRDPLRGRAPVGTGAARGVRARSRRRPRGASDRAGGQMSLRVAVVGATGVVGRTMLKLLRERRFPASEIVPFATERSAGQDVDGLTVRALIPEAELDGFDIALFSAGAGTSR